MAVDLDEFPLDDPIVDGNGRIFGDVWRAALSRLQESLTGYLSQNGMFVPRVTTDQRALIQSPEGGQLIYNTTVNEFQGFKTGTGWVNL